MAHNLETLVHSIVSRVSNEMAQEIVHIVRRQIAAEIAGTGTIHHGAAVAKRSPGRPRKNPTLDNGAGATHAAPAATRGRRGKGSRRSSTQVASDDVQLMAHIKAHPGLRSLEIGKGLKLPKTSIASGLLRLRAAKKVKTKGQRSATTYTAA